MNRSQASVLAAALVAGAASVVVALPSSAKIDGPNVGWPKVTSEASQAARTSSGADARGRTLRLVAHTEKQLSLDLGDTGDSPGDVILFEESLRDRGGRVVGRSSVRCQIVVTSQRCEATFTITGKGDIEVAGSFFFEDVEVEPVLSVTGGTGDYTGASGTLGFFAADPPTDAGLVLHVTDGADRG